MKARRERQAKDCPIIALDKFIQATRDSGYGDTASAVSELVDNSIQAGATRVSIQLVDAPSESAAGVGIQVSVLDNGCGMDPFTLRQALRFGGSSRFADRSGLGRYGMGLPNASLSQARRVTVYTWRQELQGHSRKRDKPQSPPDLVYASYLDVDEIARGEIDQVPSPTLVSPAPAPCRGPSGTLVVWTKCDRLDNRRVSTISRKLQADLGRRFRYFLWKGLRIVVNGETVRAVDPLYLRSSPTGQGARLFGTELRHEVQADPADPRLTGIVVIRFSELPVAAWCKLSNEEKRRSGISKGAGVSIVRAGREVDYGWFFMGAKHRENYDDWWRCELRFEPVLDEAFGITHTKQQVRPRAHLVEALTPDIEATARALNGRARKSHLAAKAADRSSGAERLATQRDHLLRPLPARADASLKDTLSLLHARYPSLRRADGDARRYRIVETSFKDTCFYTPLYDGKRILLILDPGHPFYRDIYGPLAASENAAEQSLRAKLDVLLLAAARGEIGTSKARSAIAQYRKEWSNVLATFLNG